MVFLSGDYHMARDSTSGATGLREYMAGPIAQYALYQESPAERARYQRAGAFHFGDGYNFGFVRVDPAARSATVEFIDAMGRVLYAAEFSP